MSKKLSYPEGGQPVVLITHRECTDGAGCAVLFRSVGWDNVYYVAAGNVERFFKKEGKGLLKSDAFIVMADVAPRETSVDLLDALEKRGNVVCLDHHKSSMGLSERPWCVIDMDACGTELLRRYLADHFWDSHMFGDEAWREFAALIDDFDRWQNKMLPLSRRLVHLQTMVGQDEFVRRMSDWPQRWFLRSLWKNDEPFVNTEAALIDNEEHRVQESIKWNLTRVVKKEQPWGMTGYVISSERQISELLDAVLKADPDLVVAVQVNFDKNIVSYRSRNGVDVSEVAALFGGGGHAAAAGSPFPDNLRQMVVDELHG